MKDSWIVSFSAHVRTKNAKSLTPHYGGTAKFGGDRDTYICTLSRVCVCVRVRVMLVVMSFVSITVLLLLLLFSAGEEDKVHLPCPQHVQPGRDPEMSHCRVLVPCGGPGPDSTGTH